MTLLRISERRAARAETARLFRLARKINERIGASLDAWAAEMDLRYEELLREPKPLTDTGVLR